MPWCATCSRFLSPGSVTTQGTCPACGGSVDPGAAKAPEAPSDDPDELDDELDPLPWHFKLMVGAVAMYLGYRVFQGIEWLVGRL